MSIIINVFVFGAKRHKPQHQRACLQYKIYVSLYYNKNILPILVFIIIVSSASTITLKETK